MISYRYVPALCMAFACALVPVVIHTYSNFAVDDGRSTALALRNLVGARTSDRPASWGKQHFDSDDWFERRIAIGSDAFVLTVIRSYDFKRLYHHPELDIAYGSSLSSGDIVYLAAYPRVPVHVLRSRAGRGLVFYVLQYDDGFVDDPISFQLRSAIQSLLFGRRPMTIFFVHDLNAPADSDVSQLVSLQTLFDALDQFTRSSMPG